MAASSPADAAPPPRAWHALDVDATLAALDSHADGLSTAEAARRLALHGPNRLPEPPPPGLLARLARQFDNLLLQVLIGAALITALIGHRVDAAVIAAVVLVNALIGFVQEGKAEKSLAAIRQLLAPRARVLREGHAHEIDAAELVPGDVVLLASGDSLPADVRMLQARHLRVDEAVLTGESVPAAKATEPVLATAAIGDRRGMAYAGTLVTQGQARAVVVATGAATEIGRIGRLMAAVEAGTTPLVARMAEFGRRLTLAILAAAALLFGFGFSVREMPVAEVFMAAVGLAVAAIPEGLPAIMTIALAIGVQRMAARHAVIRRLPAVETLGAVTVICSDKTGTLTKNEMTVQQIVLAGLTLEVSGTGYAPVGQVAAAAHAAHAAHAALAPLADVAALCNDASVVERDGRWVLTGDPTEGALATLAMKAGVEPALRRLARPRLEVIPFESEHRYMATLHAAPGGGHEALVKGAPERVLAMCAWQCAADGRREVLDTAVWQAAVEAQARAGRRVLALARRALPGGPQGLDPSHVEQGLELLGLVGIIDPPREEAVHAVRQCHEAGIRVVMITGDHAVTAAAIAAQLGLGAGGVGPPRTMTGPELEALDDAALRDVVAAVPVFARASPEHKLRLVRALRARGEVVAMTGDGVNDAPALKQADVGVAMGCKGTEAAKQAGAIVLADDNFASIARAVEEGRTVHDNLKKTVTFLLPVNGGESLSLLVAVLLGTALPIAPVQILWVNMVSSIALALVLAFEPPEADVMRRPPRLPGEPLLSRFLVWRVGFVSILFLAGIFGAHGWALAQGLGEAAARTLAVNTLVCMEVFYLFSVRYLKAPSFTLQGVKGTPRVLAAVAGVAVLQALFTWAPPLQGLFGTAALPLGVLPLVLSAGVALLVLLELEKAVVRRLPARGGPGWSG